MIYNWKPKSWGKMSTLTTFVYNYSKIVSCKSLNFQHVVIKVEKKYNATVLILKKCWYETE